MIVLRNRSFSWFSKDKVVKKKEGELAKEYENYSEKILKNLKKDFRAKLPDEFLDYLSFMYKNYKDTDIILSDNVRILSYDNIVKGARKHIKWFDSGKQNTTIPIAIFKEENQDKSEECQWCYWPRTNEFWYFNIKWSIWNGYLQPMFGLSGLSIKDSLTKGILK